MEPFDVGTTQTIFLTLVSREIKVLGGNSPAKLFIQSEIILQAFVPVLNIAGVKRCHFKVYKTFLPHH